MHFIIDRFENEYALVEMENKTIVSLPKILLPINAKEGDILEISILKNLTEQRRKEIKKLSDELWND